MSENRYYNADLAVACVRCGRRFPRMYLEDGKIVCKAGQCRQNWAWFPKQNIKDTR
jgi:hypothetical protein